MFLQVSLLAALLGTTVANPGTNSKCLASNAVGAANYQLCCPDGQGSGKGTVGEAVFEYSCSRYYTGKSGSGTMHRQVTSAKDCAQLCASSADCPGSSWQSTQKRCWVLGSANADYAPFSPAKDWMILTRSAEAPEDPDPEEECKDQVDAVKESAAKQCATEKEKLQKEGEATKTAALASASSHCEAGKTELKEEAAAAARKCETEKEQLRGEEEAKREAEKAKLNDIAKSRCEADKAAALAGANAQCATEKDQLKQQGEAQCKSEQDAASAQCEKEKAELQKQVDDARAQCQADKDSAVAAANSQCATEKDQIRQEGDSKLQQAKSQCEADKSGLRHQVKQCEDTAALSTASGQGGGQWKSVDAQCRDNSWHNLCDGSCSQRQFKLGGVDFQVKCNVRTNGMVEELWWHRQSILECAEACALTPRCLGVGWRKTNLEPERGVCHAHIKWDHTHTMITTAFPYGGGEHLIYAPARIAPTGAPGT
ncbi:hypothetical protein BBP40_009668 [Aspergillus hancockii]|nr:hypothetical protein BBP40_009668 [Aspergillus hancockii]